MPTSSPPEAPTIEAQIHAIALAMGFQSCAFVRAERYDAADHHLQSWLDHGYHGEMAYMTNHRALRVDAREMHASTQTIIALTVPYTPVAYTEGKAHIAAYAHGRDYHLVFREQLLELAARIEALVGQPIDARPVVDSAPLLERESARRGGLGWFGKSAMLVHPRHGTYTLLCELLVNLALTPTMDEQPDRCGRCERCLDVCPTGALLGDRIVDAKRCISYLTIELKGAIPRELRSAIGAHLFGCDLCQAVCPWNRFAKATTMEALQPDPARAALDARDILSLSQDAFRRYFKGTPMERSKRRGLARNASVVLGNLRREGDLDALIQALQSHEEPLVRAHAAWAIGQWYQVANERQQALDALIHHRTSEADEGVRDELEAAIVNYGGNYDGNYGGTMSTDKTLDPIR